MSALAAPLASFGAAAMSWLRQLGALGLVLARLLRALPFADARETLRSTTVFGFRSFPLALATAVFVGAILVVQTGFYVKKIGAREILGWAAGYAILREFGPLLVAMVLSGRIGARNAAEVAALTTGEQVDALEAMAIDPFRTLFAPRAVASVIAVVCLTAVGDAAAILSASGFAWLALGVTPGTFYRSLDLGLAAQDLAHGLWKSLAYGIAIAVISIQEGLAARGGGADAVGRAATRSVVTTALVILLLDFLLTRSLE